MSFIRLGYLVRCSKKQNQVTLSSEMGFISKTVTNQMGTLPMQYLKLRNCGVSLNPKTMSSLQNLLETPQVNYFLDRLISKVYLIKQGKRSSLLTCRV